MIIQTTSKQDDEFTKIIFGEIYRIDFRVVLEHIRMNYTPEEIFSESALDQWALENGYEK